MDHKNISIAEYRMKGKIAKEATRLYEMAQGFGMEFDSAREMEAAAQGFMAGYIAGKAETEADYERSKRN